MTWIKGINYIGLYTKQTIQISICNMPKEFRRPKHFHKSSFGARAAFINSIFNLVTSFLTFILLTYVRFFSYFARWTQLFYGEGTASSHRMNSEDSSIDSVEIALHMDKVDLLFCFY